MDEYCFNFLFPSNEVLPRGDDFWSIAECLGLFTGRKGLVTVFDAGDPENRLLTMKRHTLGKSLKVQVPAASQAVLCGGFDPMEENPESLLRFTCAPSGVWLGEATLPCVSVAIAASVMQAYAENQFDLVLDGLLALIGRYNVAWGFVDLFPSIMSHGGRAFGSIWYSDLHRSTLATKAIWHARCKANLRLSSIHWGNFLGNEMLAKLGGAEEFVETLTQQLTLPNGRLYGIVRPVESGVFFSLCPSIDEYVYDVTIGLRVKWLADLLVRHELL